jgi:hypothetical protein
LSRRRRGSASRQHHARCCVVVVCGVGVGVGGYGGRVADSSTVVTGVRMMEQRP